MQLAGIQSYYDIYGARATINIYEPSVKGKNGDRSASWLQINNGLREGIGAGSIVSIFLQFISIRLVCYFMTFIKKMCAMCMHGTYTR